MKTNFKKKATAHSLTILIDLLPFFFLQIPFYLCLHMYIYIL